MALTRHQWEAGCDKLRRSSITLALHFGSNASKNKIYKHVAAAAAQRSRAAN
jgi:hypothetical protein